MDSSHRYRQPLWQSYRNHSISLPFFISVAILLLLLIAPLLPLTSNISPLKSPVAQAATADTLNFQGRLLTNTGGLVADGVYNVEFNLYNVATAGSTLWTETRLVSGTGVTVQNGYFSVYLGDQVAFGAINWDQDMYLGMTIRGTTSCAWGSCTPADSEMTPRFKLTSVPYAFVSANVASSDTNAVSTNSDGVSITSGDALGATSNSGNIGIDVGTATGTAGTISLGSANATNVLIGSGSGTFSLQTSNIDISTAGVLSGATGITSSGTITFSGLNCTGNANGGALTANISGVISCSDDDGGAGGGLLTQGTGFAYLTTTTDNFVVGSATNNGGKLEVLATTEQLRLSYDASNNTTFTVSSGGDLTVTPSGGQLSLAGDLEVTAGNYLSLAGGNTASRPGSPTEGMIYFDSDTDSLLTYANGKWQADRSTATKIVAASNSSQAAKDSADYVADGNTVAAGDGDQVEINAALAALPSSGGVVYLVEGTYVTDAPISLPSNVTLLGSGPSSTIIQNDAAVSTDLIVNSDTVGGNENIEVRNLKLDGNGNTSDRGIYLDNLDSATLDYSIKVDNVRFSELGGHGISGQYTTKVHITNSSFYDTTAPIYFNSTDAIEYIEISGNYIDENGLSLDELWIDPSVNGKVIITGNYFTGHGYYALFEDASGQGFWTVSNNIFEGNTDGTVDLSGKQVTYTGNVHRNNGSGVWIGATNGFTISGNTFEDSGQITVDSGSGVISGNTVVNSSTSGIEVGSSAADVVVSNNTIINSNGATANNGIYLFGSDSSVTGNLITDSSCTTTCYAIVISGSNNYLADNTYYTTAGTDQATIYDGGTNTIYANQQVAGNTLQSGSTILKAYGTQVLTGTIDPTASTTLTGVGTKFLTELQVGDRITVSAETRTVTAIASDTSLTVDTATTDTANDLTPDRLPAALIVKNSSGVNQLVVADNGAVTITNTLAVNTLGSADTDAVLCRNTSNQLATCNSTFLTSATGFIQNGNSFTANAVLGTNDSYSLILETANTTALTIDTSQNSTFAGNVVLAAGKSLTVTGGNTASRPGSPTEGMVYFDSDTDSLLTYANGKWQSDRGEFIVVAANDSTQSEKDSADYVADGTDDQVQINAALTAATGGKVILLAGTYVTHQSNNGDATIFIPNNTTLAGTGPGTVIEFADIDATDNLIENTDTTTGTGVVIRDLKLDGRDDLNTAGAQYGIYLTDMGSGTVRDGAQILNVSVGNFRQDGMFLNDSDNNIIKDSIFENSSEGIELDYGSDNNIIENNKIRNNTTSGIWLYDANYNIIAGNVVDSNRDGVFIYDGDNNTVENNVIANNTGDAVSLYDNQPDNTVIAGNIISNNTGYGIQLESGPYSIVTSNTVSGNASGGILLYETEYAVVSNNVFTDNGAATTNNGIYLTFADSNSITNNIITDDSCTTTCYAINISSGSNNYLADNTYGVTAGTDQATIRDAGTNTRYASQQVAGKTLQSGSSLLKAYGTQVLTGTIDPTASTTLTGVGTKFLTELQVGDRITVSAETRTVTAIASDTSLTVDTATTDTANDLTPDRLPAALIVKNSSGVNQLVVADNGAVTVTNTLAVNTLGSADTDAVLCRNTSNQLATCNSTFLTAEADTLATVTARGATTTVASTFSTSLSTPILTSTAGLAVSTAAATNLTLNAGTTGLVQIGGSSTGNVELAGGSAGTGCTITNATGALACTSTINGATISAGTLSGGTVSGGTLSASAVNSLNVSGTAIAGTGALSIDGNGANTVSIGAISTGNILLGGGSASTGCTVTNATGAFACTSTINGATLSGGTISGGSLTATAVNGITTANIVLTTGSYADPSWITSLAKSKVGLSNVENTALSTWAGSTSITTLGTVGTGTWNGSIIGSLYGGTGINTSASTGVATVSAGTWSIAATLSDAQVSDTLTSSLFVGSGSTTTAVDLATAEVNGTLGATNGGTGNGFTAFTGPASTVKTFTLPNASATILTTNAAVTVGQGGTGATTFTTNGVLYGNTTGALQVTAASTGANQCLITSGVGTAPIWGSCVAGGGVTTLSAIGATPNANGATITGNTLNLQPADGSFGGVVTTGTQTFAGAKTFTGAASFTSAGTGLSVTNDATVGGILTVTGNAVFDTNTLFVDATNDFVSIGSVSDLGGKLQVVGAADEIQTLIRANATQTSNILEIQNSGSTTLFSVSNTTGATIRGTNTEAVLGSEMITAAADRDFSSATGNWSGTNWSIAGGKATHTAGNNNYTLANTGVDPDPVSGKTYAITFTHDASTAGTSTALRVCFGGACGPYVGQDTAAHTETHVVTATSTAALYFDTDATWAGTIDNVSIVEVTITTPTLTVLNDDGTTGLEVRAGGSAGYNTFIGVNAGQANTSTGLRNTALGYEALKVNTTGYDNSAIGYQSLNSNTTGYNNTAQGSQSLRSNTTGYNNTAQGSESLYNNTTGAQNTAQGYQSLFRNTTGYNNTAQGSESLYNNTTGYENTAQGYRSLYNNTTGYENTAQGYRSLYSNTTGNYNSAQGYYSLYSNTTGDSNTAQGYESLYNNTTGYENTAQGSYSLNFNTTGNYNTAQGSGSLSYNTTGAQNTAQGYSSLNWNITGDFNTAQGYRSLYNNTTGSNNSAFGTDALYNLRPTSGYTSAFADAGGGKVTVTSNSHGLSNGTSVVIAGTTSYNGTFTIANVTANTFEITDTWVANDGFASWEISGANEGDNNTAFGYRSGYLATTASNNIFLGYQAGDNITTGNNNIIIGYDLNASSATVSNELRLGGVLQGNTSTLAATFNGVLSVSGATTGDALTVNNSTSTGNIFVAQDNGTAVLTVANGGAATFTNQANSTAGFVIRNATGADVLFTANTTNNRLVVGNSTGTGTATTLLVLDSSTTAGTPTGVLGAMYYDSTNNEFKCYTGSWVDCDTGSGTTVTKKFAPEFSNMVLNADGSNNSGTLTSGYDGTAYRNFYDWSTSQATAQDYDIVVQVQIPDDYTGSPANFKFWHNDPDGATTNANTTWSMIDDTGTSCFSTTFEGTTAGVWEQETATYSTCTLSANELVTFTFKVKTTTGAGNLQLGPFEFDYNN